MKLIKTSILGLSSAALITFLAMADGETKATCPAEAGKATAECSTCQSKAVAEAEAPPAHAGKGPMAGKGMGRGGMGMSPEAHATIQGLFDSHAQFERKVELTADGYVSRTTSENPEMAKMVQSHVKQMESRLKQGLMVRRWDPAYDEFVRYYSQIDIKITPIEKGIQVVASGKTDEAKKVVRNHAGIVSRFVEYGWKEHDVAHPTAADKETTPAIEGLKVAGKAEKIQGLLEASSIADAPKACCQKSSSTEAGTKSCCMKKTAAAEAAPASQE